MRLTRTQPTPGTSAPQFRKAKRRRGATLVETAFVLPIFFMFLFFLFEMGRYFMAVNVLKSAARSAARIGSTDAGTNAMVTTEIKRLVGTLTDPNTSDLTIYIKDGQTFDQTGTPPTNYATLTNIDLSSDTIETGHLFIVRVELPYKRVSVLKPFYMSGETKVVGQAMMRKE